MLIHISRNTGDKKSYKEQLLATHDRKIKDRIRKWKGKKYLLQEKSSLS